MPAVVVKGESVYECTTCKRRVRVPANKQGMEVMQRCIITYNCQGKLNRVTQTKEINATPAFPPEVEGLQDWHQRKVLYTHEQPVQSNQWIVKHNLANRPILHVYVYRDTSSGSATLEPGTPTSTQIVDSNTVILTFDVAVSGLVQCIALSSENTVNPMALSSTSSDTAPVQISTNAGEITIATLATSPMVSLGVTFYSGSSSNNTIEYVGIDYVPSINSPWAGYESIVANGNQYILRSFNIVTTPNAPLYFSVGAISNGSLFYPYSFNGSGQPQPGEVLLLLSRSPHTNVDRVYDQYIDLGYINSSQPELYYAQGKAYAQKSVIRSIYPHILLT
jgi:hypothetical protein